MANELTIGTVETPYNSQMRGQGVVVYPFTGAATDGTAINVLAAGAASTRHMVVGIRFDVDTAGETLAITGGTYALTFRLPVAGYYEYWFDPPYECVAATALALDKGLVAAVNGYIYVIPAAVSGQMVHT